MTAVDQQAALATARKIETARARQARHAGVVLLALAVFVTYVFGIGTEGDATFRLSRPTDPWALGDLVVPAAPFNYIAAALLAFFGARLFLRGGARWIGLLLGLGLAFAVMAFLVWATAGKAFSLTGMLQATMVRAVPIALGGLAGTL